MRLIPLVATALSLLISAPSFAQEWIEYNSQRDFFSVNLPVEPNAKDITYKGEYGVDYPARVYTSVQGANRYTVTVVDYTQAEKKHADLVKDCKAGGGEGDQCNERSLTDLRGAIIYATWNLMEKAAKVTHFVYTNADRVEGHELHLANADGSRTFAAIFMHENRLYILDGTVGKNSPPPVVFQQSMRFLDKDGKSIRYQSPYSNGFPAPPRAR
jgi:hypothetical protein